MAIQGNRCKQYMQTDCYSCPSIVGFIYGFIFGYMNNFFYHSRTESH
jgi:hypothetical protein